MICAFRPRQNRWSQLPKKGSEDRFSLPALCSGLDLNGLWRALPTPIEHPTRNSIAPNPASSSSLVPIGGSSTYAKFRLAHHDRAAESLKAARGGVMG
jgi:hypothetical protein